MHVNAPELQALVQFAHVENLTRHWMNFINVMFRNGFQLGVVGVETSGELTTPAVKGALHSISNTTTRDKCVTIVEVAVSFQPASAASQGHCSRRAEDHPRRNPPASSQRWTESAVLFTVQSSQIACTATAGHNAIPLLRRQNGP